MRPNIRAFLLACVPFYALSAFCCSLTASTISPGEYALSNHPDGNLQSQAPYGIRLDSAPPSGPGPTFDVSAGPVILTWNGGSTATISGDVIRNDTGDTWNVTYTLTGVTLVDDGIAATDGFGEITYADDLPVPSPSSFPISGKLNGNGYAFLFLKDGHRLNDPNAIVGRGWIDAGGTNDWLVTATQITEFDPVPEPSSSLLMLSTLCATAAARRR